MEAEKQPEDRSETDLDFILTSLSSHTHKRKAEELAAFKQELLEDAASKRIQAIGDKTSSDHIAQRRKAGGARQTRRLSLRQRVTTKLCRHPSLRAGESLIEQVRTEDASQQTNEEATTKHYLKDRDGDSWEWQGRMNGRRKVYVRVPSDEVWIEDSKKVEWD